MEQIQFKRYLVYIDMNMVRAGVVAYPSKSKTNRASHWTESIAVGSHAFINEIKNKAAVKTVGRKMLEIIDGFKLREAEFSYNALFGAKK